MQVLPPGSLAAAAPVPRDEEATAVESSQLLDVQVEQLARTAALVAHDGPGWIERGEPVQAEPAQHQADGGDRQAQFPGDARGAQAPTPQPRNLLNPAAPQSVR